MPQPRRQDPGLEPSRLKALAHPLRYRILWRLNEVVASPKELADELGEALPKVAYHFNVLHDAEMIELVRETPRRGAIEHHYKAVARPVLRDEDWVKMPAATREELYGAVLSELLADVRGAVTAGSFQARSDWHVTHMKLALDEAGWRELGELLAKVVERALELNGEAGDDAIAARLSLLLYEGPATPEPEAS
jgi:DNA-binding transcriptional ArsR family regulator